MRCPLRAQDNAVESISGCSYDRICDEGMEITVGGKKRLLEVDTVVICAGTRTRLLSPRRACRRSLTRALWCMHHVAFQDRSRCVNWKRG